MKPNDKAYKEFMRVYNKTHVSLEAQIMASLTAAYAAQFQSEDYDWLIKRLRGIDFKLRSTTANEATVAKDAADALEALLAERDALKAELASGHMWIQMRATVLEELAMVRAERDALLARLAPVEDEALVAKAAAAIIAVEHNGIDDEFILEARAATTAIRPHIEAAERERCAKALEITSDEIRLHAGEMTAQEMRSVLAVLTWRAAAIRSRK